MATVHVKWIESKLMIGVDSAGNTIPLCYSNEREPAWKGIKPAELLLIAAASCSMYDIVEILQKQREPLKNIEITCTGENQTEPIYQYISVHLHYKIFGNVDEEKLSKAIQLSTKKYCTVINTFKECVTVTTDYEIIHE